LRGAKFSSCDRAAMSGFVRQPADAIIGMTHTKLPADCQTLLRVKHPQQSCRSCASQLKRDDAAGAILKSWMQGWRVTCRACGGAIADVWSDVDRAGPTAFGRLEEEARAGEEIIETYAGRRRSFQVSPATMLRLLLLRRRPTPQEIRDQPELPRRLIGTIIPEFDAIADDHGLNTAIGRSAVLPMFIRVRILAGLVAAMKIRLSSFHGCVNRERLARSSIGCWRKIQSSRPTRFRKAI
jgi:hypothetical protein